MNLPSNDPDRKRLMIHDYAGHAFPVDLSRELARRGHHVQHTYCTAIHAPRGELELRDDDSPTLSIQPISLGKTIAKYNFFERFKLESAYAKRLILDCEKFKPDAVLSGNTPSIVQAKLAKWCRNSNTRMIAWVQDLYGIAARKILSKKLPGVGHLAGNYMIRLDRSAAKNSDEVVVIADDFMPFYENWGIAPERIHTINNWAPLKDMPVNERDNEWSRSKNLSPDGIRFIYSGTLSIRHNPELLVKLAKKLDEWGGAELIVNSEGDSIDWLREQAKIHHIKCLKCFDFQPFEIMDRVLASADVLVSILEPGASEFCVPSKILTYMCAARSLLTAIPVDNLSARIVEQNKAGLVVAPDDVDAFIEAAKRLYDDPGLRETCGKNARAFAEANFDINQIGDRFESMMIPNAASKRSNAISAAT